jgi:hypothetical protein
VSFLQGINQNLLQLLWFALERSQWRIDKLRQLLSLQGLLTLSGNGGQRLQDFAVSS